MSVITLPKALVFWKCSDNKAGMMNTKFYFGNQVCRRPHCASSAFETQSDITQQEKRRCSIFLVYHLKTLHATRSVSRLQLTNAFFYSVAL